jgi:hypothetical protein
MAESSDLVLFVGRFHIVLLHLPIAFLLLLGMLELVAWVPGLKGANASAGYILALTVPATFAAAGCGWLLATGGEYEAHALFWHRWLGVATAGGCLLTALLHRFGSRTTYGLSLLVTIGTVVGASHFGGSLTHGHDFLFRYAPQAVRRFVPRASSAGGRAVSPAAEANAPAYVAVIQPVLDRTCVSCHGAEKQKGKLRLDTFAAVMQGGAAGPSVVAGRSAESELVKRIILPLDHDDHMPPEGKPQPTADELVLLKWWIDAGASGDRTVADLQPGPEVLKLIQRLAKPGPVPATSAKPPATPALAP